MPTQPYDIIIIGAGQSGVPLSVAMARGGRKTALVEREHVGGTCLNDGCTPTKTMVASGRVAYLARRAADYGVITGPVAIDMLRVRERKRSIVKSFVSSSEKRIASAGVDLLRGEACFIPQNSKDGHTLEIRLNDGHTTQVNAGVIVIDAGARPTMPDLPGLDGDGKSSPVPYYDSTSIMELDEVPDHLLILGGGYVGLEFGQLFRRLGSRVTIVQRGKQLLRMEDPDIAEAVTDIMRQDGLEVLLDTAALKVEKAANGAIQLSVRTSSVDRLLQASHLLIATGRTPNTAHLKLDQVGVATDKFGFIQVNDRLETNRPGIYASGDIKGGPAFTHISYDDFRILRANLLENGNGHKTPATIANRLVPYVVFIDPQLGRVGLSEMEARQQGRNIKVFKIPMTYVSRANEVDETRGLIKAIVDAENEQILGFAMLGLEGGEIMAAVEMAMLGRLPYPVVREAIFAHPTLSEALNTLFS